MSRPTDHWFEPLAEHMGSAYLRYSFTKGTAQEVDHVVEALSLSAGDRVLDVGCGPGRHSHELARRGIEVHGVDISRRFVEIAERHAPPGATFERADARSLTVEEGFDAVICLCQGAFGLMTADGDDDSVVASMARALRPGGRLALSAFSAYFVVKHWDGADFDADTGVNHERTEVRSETGEAMEAELWTGCYTPRELRLLLARNGLQVTSVSSVEPGAYSHAPADVDSPEFLVIAQRPRIAGGAAGGSAR
ncbi:class I SAM-dependent methyltransferase [Ilumatobacter sp.]|uniref:class I SAM-dependent methyltransferase n=1 Tax=Ilumatobacter sp. TaxID=1967498 RepID=UPI003B52F078